MVRYIIGALPSAIYHPSTVNLFNDNLQPDRTNKLLPDIQIEFEGKSYILDVAFCKNKRREATAFAEKITKYSVLDKK